LTAIQQRTIGRYELLREIGHGTMGVVYEARDPLLERPVAVKMIQIAFATSAEEFATFQQRFFAEARIAARLSHPGIVVVHDVGRDAETGELYIAMEHLEGRTLSEILRPAVALPWREALRITGRIAEALHYAHVNGVVHRDMKPANIMVGASGEPKIMDFGIAKTETARIKLTLAGQALGTPLYASPEQALGGPVDGRSDLFSLGAIAYSLLTGRAAFAAGNIAGVVARVIGSDPVAPSSLAPDLPPDVDRLIARALAKDPAARYQDGAAMAGDIADLLAGSPPRHLDGAEPDLRPPPLGRDTLSMPGRVHRALDLDAEFAALVEPVVAPAPQPSVSTSAGSQPGVRVAAQPALPRTALPWLGLALATLAVVGALAAARSPEPSGPPASGPVAHPAAETTSAHAAETPAAAREPGRLSIRFERPPRSAGVRVWVDRDLVAEQRWADRPAEPTRLLPFGSDGGGGLDLEPGGHDVEVEVTWDGKRSSSRIWGHVRAGETRQLRAKVSGVLKKRLSLEWE
jgi:serine/threonine protein kinase